MTERYGAGRMARMTYAGRWLWLVITLIACLGGGLTMALLYTAEESADRQRDLCELVAAYADEYAAHPPQTETGRRIAQRTLDYQQRRCN